MKAVIFKEFGAPSVLKYEDIETPAITDTQVLVKVEAAGVNFADTMQRKNQYLQPLELPIVPGFEVAGTIESVGAKVKDFKKGDRVIAMTMRGGYSEFAAAEAQNVAQMLDGVTYEQAAALPGQALTVHFMLQDANLVKGQIVAINAAAGGVGAVAAQIAKLLGASKVIGITGSAKKLDNLKNSGYDEGITTETENWSEQLLKLTDGRGVDIYLDSVGGDLFFGGLKGLAVGGRMVVFGRASGTETKFDPRDLLMKNLSVSGFSLWKYMAQPEKLKEGLDILMQHLQAGKLKITSSTYPLKEAAKVHELLEGRATTGKLILKP